MTRMQFAVEVDPDVFEWALESAKCDANAFVGLAIAEQIACEFSGYDGATAVRVVVNGCAVTLDRPEDEGGEP